MENIISRKYLPLYLPNRIQKLSRCHITSIYQQTTDLFINKSVDRFHPVRQMQRMFFICIQDLYLDLAL